MASHAPRSASSSIGIIATQTWRMQSLKRGVIRAQVDRWSGFASTGATMSWLGRSASFSLTRAERRRSRGDDKRGDFAESPEPGGRQGWQIAGQIEMPRPPNPIMKRSRRPRPPQSQKALSLHRHHVFGRCQTTCPRKVGDREVSVGMYLFPTPPGYHLRVGSEKARQPTTLAAAEAPGRTAAIHPLRTFRPRHDRTLRLGGGTAARPSPRCARRGLRRRSSPKDK